MKLSDYIPAINWIPKYASAQLKGDLIAGLTVGVMLIPQGMAYAMIAGLPPIYGLYASTVPLIIYALLGTSRQLAVGPVAMVSLLTAAGIGALAEGGTEAYLALAITLALLVGAIQFALGVFRLGFLVNFLSHPVISGFTSAAALIIGLSQLKHLLGVNLARSHHIHEILIEAIRRIGEVNWQTLAIGVIGILLIKGVKKWVPMIPGPLLAVVFGIGVTWGFGLIDFGVKIVGTVPSGLPSFSVPEFSNSNMQLLLPTALAIALVSFMESIAVAKAIQAKHKDYQVLPNQELIALGAANIGGAFFQSYPVTGGFSRTAVNDQAGAKTGMASIFSAGMIILTLLFLTPVFYFLPNAILASVIMVAVFGLIDVKEARHLWHADRSDFWMLIITFVSTLVFGIEQGIGIGVLLSLGLLIFRTTRPHMAELGQIRGTGLYKNVDRFQDLIIDPKVLIVRLDSQLYFANTNYFRERLFELIAKRKNLKTVVINAESIGNMDSSAIQTIRTIVEDLRPQGIEVHFSGVIGPVRDAMIRGGLVKVVGEDNFFLTVQAAVDAIVNGAVIEPHHDITLQTNEEHT